MSADARTSASDASPRSTRSDPTDWGDVSDSPERAGQQVPEPVDVLGEQRLVEAELLSERRQLLRRRRLTEDLHGRIARQRLGGEEDQDRNPEQDDQAQQEAPSDPNRDRPVFVDLSRGRPTPETEEVSGVGSGALPVTG